MRKYIRFEILLKNNTSNFRIAFAGNLVQLIGQRKTYIFSVSIIMETEATDVH